MSDENRVVIDAESIDEAIRQLTDQIGGPVEGAYEDIIAQIDMQLDASDMGRLLWLKGVVYPQGGFFT